MSQPTISTVIATYNRGALLGNAIRSVLMQCDPGDEVIVVDDGSTDETVPVVRSFGDRVRLLGTAHRGAGAARNAGIREAKGDYVAFLDSDDEWLAAKLTGQRAILRHFPDVLFVFSDFRYVGATGETSSHRLLTWYGDRRPWDEILGPRASSQTVPGLENAAPPFHFYIGDLYPHLLQHWTVSTITTIVRREAAGEALRFAEDVPLYEDLECFGRLARQGLACYMDCETAINHAHQGRRLTDADELMKAETAARVIERVWGADAEFLARHGSEYRAEMDKYRLRMARELLVLGRSADARQQVSRMLHPPLAVEILSRLPGAAARTLLDLRRAVRRATRRPQDS